MKGVILAGGTASRLYPLTKITNKHLLPVYNKPMIYYPIESLIKAGIKDIMIVSGRGHAGDFLELLGSGQKFGAHFSYAVQEKPGGIAQALDLAKDFVDNDKVVVYLGDNILQDDISDAVNEFKQVTMGARIFVKKVENPEAYGVAIMNGDKIENIIEKSEKFVSDMAVVGVYMYDNQVWDIIKTLKPSGRGELEITDVNNFYIKQGTMNYSILKGWWGDCGESIDTWLQANNLVAETNNKKIISKSSMQIIKDTAHEVIKETLRIIREDAPQIVKEEYNDLNKVENTTAPKNKKEILPENLKPNLNEDLKNIYHKPLLDKNMPSIDDIKILPAIDDLDQYYAE
jgi:glucose-1-phosphate thymidylyltransferase